MTTTGIALPLHAPAAGVSKPESRAPMTRKCTATLLVPTWNEIVGMKSIMPLVRREWVDQILILDGGSTDGTVEWAREQGFDVHVQTQPGLRHAYREVLPKIRGDVMITFSPDGNSLPELIPDLVAKIDEGYDMVIASRYLPPARSADDDLVTGFGNWFFTKSANLLHGGRYTDAMVIYRAYRTRLIRELELDQDRWFRTPEWLFGCRLPLEPLLSIRAARRGLKIAEIPGDEPIRIGGVRKLRVLRWAPRFTSSSFGTCFCGARCNESAVRPPRARGASARDPVRVCAVASASAAPTSGASCAIRCRIIVCSTPLNRPTHTPARGKPARVTRFCIAPCCSLSWPPNAACLKAISGPPR